MTSHDAPLRIRGRALTVADELGIVADPPRPDPEPEGVTLTGFLAALACIVVLLLAVGLTLFIVGSPR